MERVDGELMVLDEWRQHLHCLSPLAARVYEACDGSRSLEEIAAQADGLLADSPREALVGAVLEELAAKDLLTSLPARSPNTLSRRKLLVGLGVAALVVTVPAPTPAQAGSPTCKRAGHPCQVGNTDCCGQCIGGTCT